MLMDNSAFPDTCRNSHEDMLDHHDLNQNGKDFTKILDLIENFPRFGTFCSENEDLDTLKNNAPCCTDRCGSDLGIGAGRVPHESGCALCSTGRAPTHAGRGFLASIPD